MKETTKVTREEAIELLSARIKELEMIKQKGGMTVPKARKIHHQLRIEKAKLRQLTQAIGKPRKRRSLGTVASYHERVAALRLRGNV